MVSAKPVTKAQLNSTTTIPGRDGNPSFAPIRLPLRRRLETISVLFHTICIAFSLGLFFFLCTIPLLWPLLVAYIVWIQFDLPHENGVDRRQEWWRRSKIWHWYAGYFPLSLHKTHDLDPKRKYIFGYHPHGILSLGAMGNFATDATGFSKLFPGVKNTLLTLSSNFMIPVYREYLLSCGLASVSRRSCERLLRRGPGSSITIVIGGAQESLLSRPYTHDLVLKKRLGVFKIAIREGADMVPVYSFGENDVYQQIDNNPDSLLWRFQQAFKNMAGFTIPMFHARGVLNYDFGLMPFRSPIHTVVGAPIKVERKENPTLEEIQALQDKYISALTDLFNKYKDEFAPIREKDLSLIE